MIGLVILLTVLCVVLSVWCTALTLLYHGQMSVITDCTDKCNHIDSTLDEIQAKYDETAKSLVDYKTQIDSDIELFEKRITEEKQEAIAQAKHARETMQAYRLSIREQAMRQEIRTNDEGVKEVVAVPEEDPKVEPFKWEEPEEDPEEPRS